MIIISREPKIMCFNRNYTIIKVIIAIEDRERNELIVEMCERVSSCCWLIQSYERRKESARHSDFKIDNGDCLSEINLRKIVNKQISDDDYDIDNRSTSKIFSCYYYFYDATQVTQNQSWDASMHDARIMYDSWTTPPPFRFCALSTSNICLHQRILWGALSRDCLCDDVRVNSNLVSLSMTSLK